MPAVTAAQFLLSRGWAPSRRPVPLQITGADDALGIMDRLGNVLGDQYPADTLFTKEGLGMSLNVTNALQAERKTEPRYLVYDLEIVRAIPQKNEQLIPGLDYCGGWNDHAHMGVSVLCAYPSWIGTPLVFGQETLHKLSHWIQQADLVVGFNQIDFDNKVVEATQPKVQISQKPQYDILDLFLKAAGKRCKLEALAVANGGAAKLGGVNGAHAPMLWQRGETWTTINYCISDVMGLTLPVFQHILRYGYLWHPHEMGQKVDMPAPWTEGDRTHAS